MGSRVLEGIDGKGGARYRGAPLAAKTDGRHQL